METPQELTARAHRLQQQAETESKRLCGGDGEFNTSMALAKARGMTWVEGLEFSVERMRGMSASV